MRVEGAGPSLNCKGCTLNVKAEAEGPALPGPSALASVSSPCSCWQLAAAEGVLWSTGIADPAAVIRSSAPIAFARSICLH